MKTIITILTALVLGCGSAWGATGALDLDGAGGVTLIYDGTDTIWRMIGGAL